MILTRVSIILVVDSRTKDYVFKGVAIFGRFTVIGGLSESRLLVV